jgi:hypothetical protein
MSDKAEKQRRKETVHALRDKQREVIRNSFPVPVLTLKALFDFLDQRLSEDECDHTMRFVREFIAQNAMDDRVVQWLQANGGHCDCEALDNVEPVVENAFLGYDHLGRESS